MSAAADALFDLDPDDPRPPSQQIANALRAAILLGAFAPGDRLPSQHDLSRRYGVARETVKTALRILDNDQLIVSRQGRGVFVCSRVGEPLDLRAILRGAFDRPHVSIDYAGFRGETLSNVLPDALDVIREGRTRVSSLRIRMLLVDPADPAGIPRPLDSQIKMTAVRPALTALTNKAVAAVTASLAQLLDTGLVNAASIQVRVHQLGPSFKAYLLNDERVLFGFYPVTTYALTTDAGPADLHHPSGWDAALFDASDGSELNLTARTAGPPFTVQARQWFDSVWATIAHDYPSP